MRLGIARRLSIIVLINDLTEIEQFHVWAKFQWAFDSAVDWGIYRNKSRQNVAGRWLDVRQISEGRVRSKVPNQNQIKYIYISLSILTSRGHWHWHIKRWILFSEISRIVFESSLGKNYIYPFFCSIYDMEIARWTIKRHKTQSATRLQLELCVGDFDFVAHAECSVADF